MAENDSGGDVAETVFDEMMPESLLRARQGAGRGRGLRDIVFHDLARETGPCVLPMQMKVSPLLLHSLSVPLSVVARLFGCVGNLCVPLVSPAGLPRDGQAAGDGKSTDAPLSCVGS